MGARMILQFIRNFDINDGSVVYIMEALKRFASWNIFWSVAIETFYPLRF